MRSLDGKNIIITGCNRGIGKAILRMCAESGANIWACTRTFEDENKKEFESIAEKCNVWIKHVDIDFENDESIKKAAMMIQKEHLRVYGLVNNAGMPYSGLLSVTPVDDIRKVMNVNFIAQMYFTQMVSKLMVKNNDGNIVNISSISGLDNREGFFAYGASKAAVIWATRSLSKEYGKHGIRVNGIAPGLIETRLGNGMHTQLQIDNALELSTMKRWGKPVDIANVVIFLLSDESSFMTGQILQVDGGR